MTIVVSLITVIILRWSLASIRSVIEAEREIDAALEELVVARRFAAALLEAHAESEALLLVAEVEEYVRRAADERT
jgi:hypothetical protein